MNMKSNDYKACFLFFFLVKERGKAPNTSIEYVKAHSNILIANLLLHATYLYTFDQLLIRHTLYTFFFLVRMSQISNINYKRGSAKRGGNIHYIVTAYIIIRLKYEMPQNTTSADILLHSSSEF